jgi:3-methyladenine DNA glycosylase/8-oxoguanine DNA glycosylase
VPLLPIPTPYDFALSTERYRAFGPDLANLWFEGGLLRVVARREVRIEPTPGGVLVEPLDAEIEQVVRKLLGLEFDLGAFAAFAAAGEDTVLRRLSLELEGFRPPLAPDPFESLVTSITAQQISLYAAFAIRNRLLERYGDPGARAYAWPDRDRLAQARETDLVSIGYSRRKAEYVVGLARSDLDLHELAGLSDDEVKARLRTMRGLGEWTADWYLARHLARPQAWPAGDLGLRKAASAFYGEGRSLSTEEVRAIGTRFAPFQNLTAHYLLTGLRVVGAP